MKVSKAIIFMLVMAFAYSLTVSSTNPSHLCTCPAGKDSIGLNCYDSCPSGYRRFGFDCHQNCPSGFRDDGLFCRMAEYGRGGGYPWRFQDGFNNNGMMNRC